MPFVMCRGKALAPCRLPWLLFCASFLLPVEGAAAALAMPGSAGVLLVSAACCDAARIVGMAG